MCSWGERSEGFLIADVVLVWSASRAVCDFLRHVVSAGTGTAVGGLDCTCV